MQNLPIKALQAPLAVVCHDAGATNILAAWLRQYTADFKIYADGPATEILMALFPTQRFVESLDQCLDGASSLLSGTGWASDLEHQARKWAKERGIYTIAVIDHWVNYEQRFSRKQEQILPDEIWLADNYALHIAEEKFPHTKLRVLPNLYLADLVEEIGELGNRKESCPTLLYILEPIRSSWGMGELSGEFQALEYFLEHLSQLKIPDNVEIILRPHPSEPVGKYDSIVNNFTNLTIFVDNKASLAEQIARSHWVVGCESFALVIALEAGKQVISSLPPWAPACRLPQPGLQHIRDML